MPAPACAEAVGRELFVADPAGNVALFADLVPGPQSSDPRELTVAGGYLFVKVGSALWRTDGTAPGTIWLAEVATTADLTAVGNQLLFTELDPAFGGEPWISDGTATAPLGADVTNAVWLTLGR